MNHDEPGCYSPKRFRCDIIDTRISPEKLIHTRFATECCYLTYDRNYSDYNFY